MQRCGQCGHNNPDESIFCGQCSYRLNNRCTHCSYPNLVTQKFCGNCGRQLREDESLPAAARPDASFSDSLPPVTETPPSLYPIEGTPVITAEGALPESALLSLEFANWEQATARASDPASMERAREQYILGFAQAVREHGGQVGHSKKGVLFATFPFAAGLRESLLQALALALPWLQEEFRFGNTLLRLKAGLDIEKARQRNPLASSLERSLAQAGTLILNEAVYRQVHADYPAEALEPFSVGGYVVQLFRLAPASPHIPDRQPPEEFSQQDLQVLWEQDAVSPPPSAPSPPSPPVLPPQTQSIRSASLSPEPESLTSFPVDAGTPPSAAAPTSGTMPPFPTSAFPETDDDFAGSFATPPVSSSFGETASAPFPEPPSSLPMATSEAPPDSSRPEAMSAPMPSAPPVATPPSKPPSPPPASRETEAALSDLFPAGRPEAISPKTVAGVAPLTESTPSPSWSLPVPYTPPALAAFQPPRAPNLRYNQAIDALGVELNSFLSAAESGAGQRSVLALCASDGLGKSNIIGLARMAADPEGHRAIWLGGGNSRSFAPDGLPLFCWLDVMYNLLGLLPEGQPRQAAQERIRRFLDQAFEGRATEEDYAFLASLLSVEQIQPLSLEARALGERMRAFFQRLIRRLTEKRPVILVLEDLMLADPASLEFLASFLTGSPPEIPVCILLTYTRDFQPQGILQQALQSTPCKELITADLDDTEIGQFLDNGPLGGHFRQFPTALINALCRQSAGLPLWLEEALRLLHLRGVIVVDPTTHQFRIQENFRASDALLPDSLLQLVQERLQGLDDTTLYVLRLAAALGEKFPVALVQALAQMEPDEFHQAMEILANQGYLLMESAQTTRFRHGLLREAVYLDIEPGLRAQMHQLISETLENDFNQGLTVNPLLIAHHSQAGAMLSRALNYWHLAGTNAGWLGALTAMNIAMFRALELLLQTTGAAFPQQELALRTMESLGAFNVDDAPAMAADLLGWAYQHRQAQGGDVSHRLEILGFQASAYERQGDLTRMLETLDRSLALIDPRTYPLERVSLQIHRMECLAALGRFQEAHGLMAAEIDPVAYHPNLLSDSPPVFEACLRARLLQAHIMLAQCDRQVFIALDATRNDIEKIAVTSAEHESLMLEWRLLQLKTWLQEGRYDDYRKESERVLGVIEAMAGSDWFLAQWGLLAIQYHVEMEDWESVSQLVLTVLAKAEAVNDYHTRSMAEVYAGYVTGKRGYVQDGSRMLEQALTRAAEHRFASVALVGWRLLADFELMLGHVDIAVELLDRALAVARKPDIQNHDESIRLMLLRAHTLLMQGQAQQAGKILEPLWPQLAQAGWQPLLASCAFVIGQLYLNLASQNPPGRREKHQARGQEFLRKSRAIWQGLHHALRVRQIDGAIAAASQSMSTGAKS